MVALGLAAHRVLRYVETHDPEQPLRIGRRILDLAGDPTKSDAEVADAAGEESATVVDVATYTEPFEVRKLQVVWGFNAGSPLGDDVRVATFHHLRLSGGSPSADWAAADFEAVEAAFDTFWAALRPYWRSEYVLQQLRWYKAGPAISPPQEPVRVVDRNVAGSQVSTIYNRSLPPQVAVSVSEKTATRKHWGRFYLPTPATNKAGDTNADPVTTAAGRFHSGFLSIVANAADAHYEACRTANVPIVVYSAAKPERPKEPSGTLPPQAALAITVDNLQVDDIPDVIRSRRFSAPTLRVQRAVGA